MTQLVTHRDIFRGLFLHIRNGQETFQCNTNGLESVGILDVLVVLCLVIFIVDKLYWYGLYFIQDSTMNFPQIHEIVDLIIKQVVSLELDLVTFWSEVVRMYLCLFFNIYLFFKRFNFFNFFF